MLTQIRTRDDEKRYEAPFIVLGCPMPIDEHTIVHRQSVIVSNRLPPLVRDLVARFVGWTAMREFNRDVPIWQNKVVVARPVLCDGDGPIVRFRTWARQFEAARSDAPATSGLAAANES
jgi:3-ketosteroid 9alpha-monooxygenase subunit A